MFFKWIFKTACAIFILSNTFNIVMAVFDVSQTVIAQAGVIQGSTDITPDMMTELETTLEGMDLGPLLACGSSPLYRRYHVGAGHRHFRSGLWQYAGNLFAHQFGAHPYGYDLPPGNGTDGAELSASLFAVGFQGLLFWCALQSMRC